MRFSKNSGDLSGTRLVSCRFVGSACWFSYGVTSANMAMPCRDSNCFRDYPVKEGSGTSLMLCLVLSGVMSLGDSLAGKANGRECCVKNVAVRVSRRVCRANVLGLFITCLPWMNRVCGLPCCAAIDGVVQESFFSLAARAISASVSGSMEGGTPGVFSLSGAAGICGPAVA